MSLRLEFGDAGTDVWGQFQIYGRNSLEEVKSSHREIFGMPLRNARFRLQAINVTRPVLWELLRTNARLSFGETYFTFPQNAAVAGIFAVKITTTAICIQYEVTQEVLNMSVKTAGEEIFLNGKRKSGQIRCFSLSFSDGAKINRACKLLYIRNVISNFRFLFANCQILLRRATNEEGSGQIL